MDKRVAIVKDVVIHPVRAFREINEAWTGLRIIKQDLDFMNNQINRGNNALQGSSIDLIETYLEKIPTNVKNNSNLYNNHFSLVEFPYLSIRWNYGNIMQIFKF